mmetsp:Transcript_67575/g.148172  ORF Transcript_67575/g.148172 Transcript_67575/m.148172 type:complete len:274 (+) Transcript_67575:43-864(+)
MAHLRNNENFGMDRELKMKEDAKRDPALEAKVENFIYELTGEKPQGGMIAGLRDGVLLCKAMNAVKPGAIAKVNAPGKSFKERENISFFLKSCRTQLGMHEADLFTTPDLYDERSPVNVCSGIVAFSRAASKAGFNGPSIAPKESQTRSSLSKAGKAVKRWSINARNAGVSMLNMGSAGIMERKSVTKTGITFGSDYAGKTSDKGGMTALSKGGYGIQERPELEKRGITFGSDMAGKSNDKGGVSKMNAGSAGIMNRGHVVKSGPTFGADAGK